MADRTCHDMQHMSREVKVISGIISIAGAASAANNVVSLEYGGHGVASVARTGTGEITVTLDDKWVECHGVTMGFQPEAGEARQAQVKSFDVTSTKKIIFETTTEALVAGDTPNGDTDRIHFALFLKNSQVR